MNRYHNLAREKGWWDDRDPSDPKDLVVALALIGTEVSEAIQEVRKGDLENLGPELADIVIRCFDLAGGLDIDLFSEMNKKHEKNMRRSHKHGKLL